MTRIAIQELEQLLGQEEAVSDWLLVDQERVNKFADTTGDFQWVHVDVERASREIGGTIAHGFLILSLLPVLHESILEVTGVAHAVNYGLNKVRFTGATLAGSHIRLRERLLSLDAKGGGVLATFAFVIERQGEERPVCVAEAVTLLYPA